MPLLEAVVLHSCPKQEQVRGWQLKPAGPIKNGGKSLLEAA